MQLTEATETHNVNGMPLLETEIRVSKSWLRFIRWCQVNIPNGQICFTISNSEPKGLVNKYSTKSIRFDKEQDFPVEFEDFTQRG